MSNIETVSTEEQQKINNQAKEIARLTKLLENREPRTVQESDLMTRIADHQQADYDSALEKLMMASDMDATIEELLELKAEYKKLKAKPFSTGFDYNIKRNIQDRVRDALDELPRELQGQAKAILPSAITPYFRGRI